MPRSDPMPATPSVDQGSNGESRPNGSAGRVRTAGRATTSDESQRVATGSSRTRGARAIQGTAQARDFRRGGGDSFVVYYPSHFGYNTYFGSYAYDPWFGYGSNRWSWSLYSGWYAPYRYPYHGPYVYDPYGWGGPTYWEAPYAVTTGGGWSGWRGDDANDDREMGSVRLRANPREAKVYVDGALAGTVDDFDGFSDHLKLDAGKHQLELRLDGYQPYSTEVTVEAGRTLTTRASLKRSR
jgi:hypothetical protein